MTTIQSPAAPQTHQPPSLFSLIRAHAKAQVLEQLRIPIAVISSAIFPTMTFLFFILPQSSITEYPPAVLTALAQLAMFGVLSAFLFGYGIGVAEDRANPWTTYLRTLPLGPVPPTVGRAVTAMLFSFIALLPLFLLGALTTRAFEPFIDGTLEWWRIPVTIVTLLLAGLPFLFLGLMIGYLCTAKVAIAVVQVVFFPLSFVGGMLLPPMVFPDWLNVISLATPTRAARDLSVEVLTGAGLHASTIPVLLAWTLVFGALALWANRRDQGRRFR